MKPVRNLNLSATFMAVQYPLYTTHPLICFSLSLQKSLIWRSLFLNLDKFFKILGLHRVIKLKKKNHITTFL